MIVKIKKKENNHWQLLRNSNLTPVFSISTCRSLVNLRYYSRLTVLSPFLSILENISSISYFLGNVAPVTLVKNLIASTNSNQLRCPSLFSSYLLNSFYRNWSTDIGIRFGYCCGIDVSIEFIFLSKSGFFQLIC